MTARDIAALFESLELELVQSLHRSLTRHQKQERTEGGKDGTPQHWEAWQAAKLRDIRRFRRENTAILGEYRDRIDAGTRALLEEEAAQGGTDGFFRMDDTRMTALLNEMQQANEQSERAALRYMNDVYRKTILRTAAAMQAGGQTLQQAADAATRDFLEQGIACIRYRDGRRVNISTYAEMALRTAGTRAMLMGEAAQRERLGIDTVLVSQYGACSKTCLPWQGLVYIDDVFQQYSGPHTPGGTYGISRNGRQYPLLSVAMRGGLFHPNCRHTLSTWVEGTSTRPRPMDKARVEAVARLEARQRALERNVRKAKRRAAGLCDPDAIKAARASVRTAQKELRDFVADHGDVLRRDVWRERDVAGTVGGKGRVVTPSGMQNILAEYQNNAQPNTGAITYDYGYRISHHAEEIKTARWLHENLGGDIVLLRESTERNQKRPDFLWNQKQWELKSVTTAKASDSALRSAVKQINENPGGIILDCGANEIPANELQSAIENRIKRSCKFDVDILVLQKDKLVMAYRYKNKSRS